MNEEKMTNCGGRKVVRRKAANVKIACGNAILKDY